MFLFFGVLIMERCIATVSTMTGEAGIGIVRMSGKGCWDVGKKVFVPAFGQVTEADHRKMKYGHIMEDDQLVDEVMICFMKAPNTYTREDMVEIYTHGGPMSVKKVYRLLLEKGAVPAERGEFTKRAFLNGRIDLSQAEAVKDLVSAKTDMAYKASLNQLEGGLQKEITGHRQKLLNVLSTIEYAINFTEDDDTYDVAPAIVEGRQVLEALLKMRSSANRGKIVKEGIRTVIVGKPNVGKSSILNALLRENRAIVTDVAGTTRDVIEEMLDLGGIALRLMDTAGIRETEDVVEAIGVERSLQSLQGADLVLAVFDVSQALDEEDREVLDHIRDKNAIILLNKEDLAPVWEPQDLGLDHIDLVTLSAETGTGLEDLEQKILDRFFDGGLPSAESLMITNERHAHLLDEAIEALDRAILDLEAAISLELCEVDVRSAWLKLGEITGETADDDVLNKIFSDFCIGK